MGEAKRKLEAMRASMLENIERWSFPPSDWEKAVVASISQLTVVMVERASDDQLAWARMKPQECHANARFMEENCPDGRTRQILGWWFQQGQYVLHSVIRQGDTMICVTPSPYNTENPFQFIPDDEIEVRKEGDQYVFYRNEQPIGPGVRGDPETALRKGATLRKRLKSGINPYEVMRL